MNQQTVQFKNDLNGYLSEVQNIQDNYTLHKYIMEKTSVKEDLNALNKAPAFFTLPTHSFQYTVIMGLAKFIEPPRTRGEAKSLSKFLNFLEANHSYIFSNDPLEMERLGRTTPIDASTVSSHKTILEEMESIISHLITWRDKSFAHNDSAYFVDRSRLATDYPITYGEIERLIGFAIEMLNTYNVGFSGSVRSFELTNINDVDNVLRALKL
ncbi:MAG TPA: hypothetical protein DCP50_07435 [Exiguobacterium sp.]|nr:hypothetical protein [Exiguobacterium sp.]